MNNFDSSFQRTLVPIRPRIPGVLLACFALAVFAPPVAASTTDPAAAAHPATADAALQLLPAELRRMARWVVESGDNDGLPYFSLELCSGGSLAERLKASLRRFEI